MSQNSCLLKLIILSWPMVIYKLDPQTSPKKLRPLQIIEDKQIAWWLIRIHILFRFICQIYHIFVIIQTGCFLLIFLFPVPSNPHIQGDKTFLRVLGDDLQTLSSRPSGVTQSCPTLCNPMDSSLHQAPPSMGFSRQEYWSGVPFPSPGNLPNSGIKPRSLTL